MPFIIFESATSMSEETVVSILKSSLTQLDWIGRPKSSAPFLGSVSNSSFKITRIIKGRDSFNPMLYGRFHSSNEGTCIKVIMTYHPVMWLIMIAWTISLGNSLLHVLSSGTYVTVVPLIFMLVFPWAIGVPLFYYNADKSKKLLQRRLHLTDIRQK